MDNVDQVGCFTLLDFYIYPSGTATGITVASSTMGMIIPPSTPMIVYSMISGGSVGALFMAGAISGVLIGITQLILVYVFSEKNHWHPKRTKLSGKEVKEAVLGGLPALILPFFIIICVSGGVCTASESAGVAVLYSLLVGFFIYHELSWKQVWEALKKSFISSSSILLLTPILLPVMHAYGFSTLQFGAMMITGLAIGLVTPPVGMCLNACNKINGMPVIEIFKHAVPYIACNVFVLIAISVYEPLTTWLPLMMGYSLN